MNKRKKNDSFINVTGKLMRMVFKACPLSIAIFIIISIAQGVSFSLITVVTQTFFDTINKYINGNVLFKDVLITLGILGVSIIYSQLLNGVTNIMESEIPKKVKGKIEKKINLKCERLDLIDFENPMILDDINKAEEGLSKGIGLVFIILMIMASYGPYFIFMEVYLYKVKPILTISIILLFVPSLIAQVIKITIYSKLEDKIAPYRRKCDYYEKYMIDREYFKETRLFKAVNYFKNLYSDSIFELNYNTWESGKKSAILGLIIKSITLSGYLSVLIMLILCLINGEISVGAFGAIFSAVDMMFMIIQEIVCIHVSDIVESLGTVMNFFRFIYMPEREGSICDMKNSSDISLSNVSFVYPGSEKYALKDIFLDIKENETIAIVGENGSGKSTLTKIITGMYIPSEGNVFISGQNTKDIYTECLYKNISAVFQKYKRYKMSLKENIKISDTKIDEDIYKIGEAIDKSKLDVSKEKFRDGYDTMLAKEFDGIDLSGGQWQKIAIARGLYRDSKIIVLDEPTASIDPIEEDRIYKKFSEISKDRTSIIVTHRLGASKIADRIVVLDKGSIVQIGTYEELINVEGKYKEMYKAQSEWYKAN